MVAAGIVQLLADCVDALHLGFKGRVASAMPLLDLSYPLESLSSLDFHSPTLTPL